MEGFGLNELEKMVVVTDDWYPCFEGNKIKISIFITFFNNSKYHFVKISVWGADDFGLELYYENENYDNLVAKYNEWKENIYDKAVDGINQDWFYERGFSEF